MTPSTETSKRKNNAPNNRRHLLPLLILLGSVGAVGLLWPTSAQPENDLPTARLLYNAENELLISLNLKTGEETPLLFAPYRSTDYDSTIKFSPDGKWSARWRQRWHGGVTFSELYVSSRETTNGTTQTKSLGGRYGVTYFVSWSADSQWVAFSAEPEPQASIYYDSQFWDEARPILEEEIYLRNIYTYAEQRLTDNAFTDRYPAISPDGTQLVYTSDASGEDRLYIMEIATRESRILTPDREGYMPSWSPDGRWIAFNTNCESAPGPYSGGCDDLWLIRADGTGAQSIKDGTGTVETFWLP